MRYGAMKDCVVLSYVAFLFFFLFARGGVSSGRSLYIIFFSCRVPARKYSLSKPMDIRLLHMGRIFSRYLICVLWCAFFVGSGSVYSVIES